MSDAKEQIDRRSEEAFARSAWRDPRTDYRAMLRHLRERDAAGFENAVREYDARVATKLAEDASADPVAAWLAYGRRLADLIGGGRTVRVDADGRSEADDGGDAPALLLHLPADESATAIVVAEPREPSPAQRASIALLADRRTALPQGS